MKKKMILFTAALAVSLCVSTAIYAEDHGLGIADGIRSLLSDEEVQNALFGEEGLINEILPEGTDLQTVEEQIALVESQGSQILDALQSKIDSAGSSLDLSSPEDLAGELIAALIGSELPTDADLSGMIETYGATLDAIKESYIEKNAESMDPADVQIVSITHIYQDSDYDQPQYQFLTYLSQDNYRQDGSVLRYVSGASDPVLFTFSKDEDGSVHVVDAVYAQDGEGWKDSLQAMGDEVGMSVEEILSEIDFSEYLRLSEMINYLDEHEDIEGLEYMGEIRTSEELRDIQTAFLDELDTETEAETEAE